MKFAGNVGYGKARIYYSYNSLQLGWELCKAMGVCASRSAQSYLLTRNRKWHMDVCTVGLFALETVNKLSFGANLFIHFFIYIVR